MLVRRGSMGFPGHSSWLPGAEVDDAWDSSWRRRCFAWLYLAAKSSHLGIDVDGIACPLHRPMVYDCQARGQSFLLGTALSCHAVVGAGTFPGGEAPGYGYLVKCWPYEYPCDRILHEEDRFYQCMLILHQSYYGDYACILGRVAMSDGDEMNSSTWVQVASARVGSCGHVLSCQAINASAFWDPDVVRAYLVLKTLGRITWTSRPIPGRGGRQNVEIDGEILPTHDYHK
jgi:hypothetical protein